MTKDCFFFERGRGFPNDNANLILTEYLCVKLIADGEWGGGGALKWSKH